MRESYRIMYIKRKQQLYNKREQGMVKIKTGKNEKIF